MAPRTSRLSSAILARVDLIGENLTRCGVTGGYTILRADMAAAGPAGLPAAFDLVFLDPPYAMAPDEAVEAVAARDRAGRPVGDRARAAQRPGGVDRRARADAHTDGRRQRVVVLQARRATSRIGMSMNQQSRTHRRVPRVVRSAHQRPRGSDRARRADLRSRGRRDSGERAEDAAAADRRPRWRWRARSSPAESARAGGDLRRPAGGLCRARRRRRPSCGACAARPTSSTSGR